MAIVGYLFDYINAYNPTPIFSSFRCDAGRLTDFDSHHSWWTAISTTPHTQHFSSSSLPLGPRRVVWSPVH